MLTAFSDDQVGDAIAFADRWLTGFASVTFSATEGFLFAAGTALVAKQGTTAAIGAGMVSAATMAMITWRRVAPAGTVVAAPGEEAAAEINASTQIISK